jgi:hypothetical protein
MNGLDNLVINLVPALHKEKKDIQKLDNLDNTIHQIEF